MKKILKISLWSILALLIALQFYRIDKNNPPVDPAIDFQSAAQPPVAIVALLKKACYDCHSHETKYPWYANLAPVSIILDKHIKEGREHLNFSVWGNYPADERAEMLEEAAEEISEGKMPLWDYLLMHPEAKLTQAEKTELINWFGGTGENRKHSGKEEGDHEEEEEEEEEEEDDDDDD